MIPVIFLTLVKPFFVPLPEVVVYLIINLPCLSAQKRAKSGKVMLLTRQSYGYSDMGLNVKKRVVIEAKS